MPRKKRVEQAQKLSIYRRVHTYAGLVSVIFLLSLSITGILLNHPDWMKCDEDKSKPVLEQAVRATVLEPETGNHFRVTDTGLYHVSKSKTQKIAMRYPAKDIEQLYFDHQNRFYLIFKHGLVLRAMHNLDHNVNNRRYIFERLTMPDNVYIISDFSVVDDRILLKTELGLFESEDLGKNWVLLQQEEVGFKTWVKRIHTGYFPGLPYGEKWLMVGNDIGAILLILLIITGIIIYIRTLLRERDMKRDKRYKKNSI